MIVGMTIDGRLAFAIATLPWCLGVIFGGLDARPGSESPPP